jgi:hypothetical protein
MTIRISRALQFLTLFTAHGFALGVYGSVVAGEHPRDGKDPKIARIEQRIANTKKQLGNLSAQDKKRQEKTGSLQQELEDLECKKVALESANLPSIIQGCTEPCPSCAATDPIQAKCPSPPPPAPSAPAMGALACGQVNDPEALAGAELLLRDRTHQGDPDTAKILAKVLGIARGESAWNTLNVTDMSSHGTDNQKDKRSPETFERVIQDSSIKLNHMTNFGLLQMSADRFAIHPTDSLNAVLRTFMSGSALHASPVERQNSKFFQSKYARYGELRSLKDEEFFARCGTPKNLQQHSGFQGLGEKLPTLAQKIPVIAKLVRGSGGNTSGADREAVEYVGRLLTACPRLNYEFAFNEVQRDGMRPKYFETRDKPGICQAEIEEFLRNPPSAPASTVAQGPSQGSSAPGQSSSSEAPSSSGDSGAPAPAPAGAAPASTASSAGTNQGSPEKAARLERRNALDQAVAKSKENLAGVFTGDTYNDDYAALRGAREKFLNGRDESKLGNAARKRLKAVDEQIRAQEARYKGPEGARPAAPLTQPVPAAEKPVPSVTKPEQSARSQLLDRVFKQDPLTLQDPSEDENERNKIARLGKLREIASKPDSAIRGADSKELSEARQVVEDSRRAIQEELKRIDSRRDSEINDTKKKGLAVEYARIQEQEKQLKEVSNELQSKLVTAGRINKADQILKEFAETRDAESWGPGVFNKLDNQENARKYVMDLQSRRSDSKLSPSEKAEIQKEWDALEAGMRAAREKKTVATETARLSQVYQAAEDKAEFKDGKPVLIEVSSAPDSVDNLLLRRYRRETRSNFAPPEGFIRKTLTKARQAVRDGKAKSVAEYLKNPWRGDPAKNDD